MIPRSTTSPLAADTRGSVLAEYTVTLVVIGLTCALLTIALGLPLVHLFLFQQACLLLPIP
jgi:hypothetical protein